MVSLIALLLALPAVGQGCPHEGPDHRLLGRVGCQIQRKMTIERARPPRTIWSFHLLKLSVKIDPRHPHLLVEIWIDLVGDPITCQNDCKECSDQPQYPPSTSPKRIKRRVQHGKVHDVSCAIANVG